MDVDLILARLRTSLSLTIITEDEIACTHLDLDRERTDHLCFTSFSVLGLDGAEDGDGLDGMVGCLELDRVEEMHGCAWSTGEILSLYGPGILTAVHFCSPRFYISGTCRSRCCLVRN